MKEYYTSLREIPVKNYFEILNTGNYAWLYKFIENGEDTKRTVKKLPKLHHATAKKFKKIFEQINYEHDEVPIDKSTKDMLDILVLKYEYFKTGRNRTNLLLKANEKMKRLETRLGKDKHENINIGRLVTDVEEFTNYNIQIDEYTFPAYKFFRLFNKMKD